MQYKIQYISTSKRQTNKEKSKEASSSFLIVIGSTSPTHYDHAHCIYTYKNTNTNPLPSLLYSFLVISGNKKIDSNSHDHHRHHLSHLPSLPSPSNNQYHPSTSSLPQPYGLSSDHVFLGRSLPTKHSN